MPEFLVSRGGPDPDVEDESSPRIFKAFDEFLDRMPAWLFHSLGLVTALVALWFALALLGGLPRGIVEWIATAMFAAFAYAVGFMIPLLVAYLVDSATRFSVFLIVTGGMALLAAVAFQGPV